MPTLRRLAACLLIAGACGCRARPIGTYRGAPVVLISIDTLRADHLPLYGYAVGATPAIDALGREGIVFESVYSHVPLTLPAHASLLTGLLPPRHGVRDNIGFTLGATHATLATRFKAAGYATAGAVSAYVLRSGTGISQGFDQYDDAFAVAGPEQESLGEIQRDGAQAVESLARWVDAHAARPFFAFLHLYEPHSPYTPPPRFDRFSLPYDGEIAYADDLVGRFLGRLEAKGVYDRAIVALTSDHGEGLRQHGEEEHGIFLYQEAVHVPLVLRLPGGARGGSRVSGPVAEVDIPATILDLAGVPAAGLDGVSLRAAVDAGTAPPRTVYSETLYPRYHFGWSELYAATASRYRYIKAPRPELYDLASDPDERNNLAQARAATVAAMDRWLAGKIGEVSAPGEVSPEVREKLQALGYVGSSPEGAAGGERPDPKDRIGGYEDLKHALLLHEQRKDEEAARALRKVLDQDPGMIDAWEVLGTTLVRMGRYDEGIEALHRTLALDPARSQTHMALVKAYVLQGKTALALREAELAAAGDPANGYEALAQIMLDLGKLEPAAGFARKSLAADPQRSLSHFVLGQVARRLGQCGEALVQFRHVQELASRLQKTMIRSLHANMADCLARMGREAEAEREFKAEIEEMPASREGRVGLAMLYRSQGRDAEARDVLAGLVAAEPEPSPDTYWTVVQTLSVLGDGAAAHEWLARARARFPSDARFR